MKWIFLRTLAALVITIVAVIGLRLLSNEAGGESLGPAPVFAQQHVFDPLSARLGSLPPERRQSLLDDLNASLGFELALESPPSAARPAARAPEGADMRQIDGETGQLLYSRLWGTDQWLRASLPEPTLSHRIRFVASVLLVVLLGAGTTIVLSRPLARQLAALHEAAERLEAGDMSARARVRPRTELERFALAFNAMAGRRQADDAEREALLQAVAHELTTPLARIGFSVDFLRSAESEDERERQITSIEEDLVSLDRLTREVVAWVESGAPRKTVVDESLVPIADVVEERVAYARQHTELALELRDELCAPVLIADEAGLSRVLDNLLQNAARYATSRVVVECRSQPGAAVVEVRDDGCGIPKDQRERVFEPFARVEEHRSRERGGLGLGLAIVSRTVTRAGGSVRVETAAEGGASLVVVWPARSDER